MIDGVEIKQLHPSVDDRGFVMEMLRSDDPIFEAFGQSYVALNYPGVIRAWHYHKEQTDLWVCAKGMIKVGLYDAREGSPTKGEIQTVCMGEHNYVLLKIPVGVYHGTRRSASSPRFSSTSRRSRMTPSGRTSTASPTTARTSRSIGR